MSKVCRMARIEFNPQKDLLGYVIKRISRKNARAPLTSYLAN